MRLRALISKSRKSRRPPRVFSSSYAARAGRKCLLRTAEQDLHCSCARKASRSAFTASLRASASSRDMISETCLFCSLPAPTPWRAKITESGLEPIVISAAYCLEPSIFIARSVLSRIGSEPDNPVAKKLFAPKLTNFAQPTHQASSISLVRSNGSRRQGLEKSRCSARLVAALRRASRGFCDRDRRRRTRRTPSGGSAKRVLEPGIKGAVHEVCRLVFGGDLEKWVDPCFDRTFAE